MYSIELFFPVPIHSLRQIHCLLQLYCGSSWIAAATFKFGNSLAAIQEVECSILWIAAARGLQLPQLAGVARFQLATILALLSLPFTTHLVLKPVLSEEGSFEQPMSMKVLEKSLASFGGVGLNPSYSAHFRFLDLIIYFIIYIKFK